MWTTRSIIHPPSVVPQCIPFGFCSWMPEWSAVFAHTHTHTLAHRGTHIQVLHRLRKTPLGTGSYIITSNKKKLWYILFEVYCTDLQNKIVSNYFCFCLCFCVHLFYSCNIPRICFQRNSLSIGCERYSSNIAAEKKKCKRNRNANVITFGHFQFNPINISIYICCCICVCVFARAPRYLNCVRFAFW